VATQVNFIFNSTGGFGPHQPGETDMTLTYNKNGFDIKATVTGTGYDAVADVMYKPYGEAEYLEIGQIYKTTTMACGTTRDAATWHHVKASSPMYKKTWYEAAADLYCAFRKEAA